MKNKRITISAFSLYIIAISSIIAIPISLASYAKIKTIQFEQTGQNVLIGSEGVREYVYNAVETVYLVLANHERVSDTAPATYKMVLKRDGSDVGIYTGTAVTGGINGYVAYSFSNYVSALSTKTTTILFTRNNASNDSNVYNRTAEIEFTYYKDLFTVGERITLSSGYQYYNLTAGTKAND